MSNDHHIDKNFDWDHVESLWSALETAVPEARTVGRKDRKATSRTGSKTKKATKSSSSSIVDAYSTPAPTMTPKQHSRQQRHAAFGLSEQRTAELPQIGKGRLGTPVKLADFDETTPRQTSEKQRRPPSSGTDASANSRPRKQRGAGNVLTTPSDTDDGASEVQTWDAGTLMEKKTMLPYIDKFLYIGTKMERITAEASQHSEREAVLGARAQAEAEALAAKKAAKKAANEAKLEATMRSKAVKVESGGGGTGSSGERCQRGVNPDTATGTGGSGGGGLGNVVEEREEEEWGSRPSSSYDSQEHPEVPGRDFGQSLHFNAAGGSGGSGQQQHSDGGGDMFFYRSPRPGEEEHSRPPQLPAAAEADESNQRSSSVSERTRGCISRSGGGGGGDYGASTEQQQEESTSLSSFSASASSPAPSFSTPHSVGHTRGDIGDGIPSVAPVGSAHKRTRPGSSNSTTAANPTFLIEEPEKRLKEGRGGGGARGVASSAPLNLLQSALLPGGAKGGTVRTTVSGARAALAATSCGLLSRQQRRVLSSRYPRFWDTASLDEGWAEDSGEGLSSHGGAGGSSSSSSSSSFNNSSSSSSSSSGGGDTWGLSASESNALSGKHASNQQTENQRTRVDTRAGAKARRPAAAQSAAVRPVSWLLQVIEDIYDAAKAAEVGPPHVPTGEKGAKRVSSRTKAALEGLEKEFLYYDGQSVLAKKGNELMREKDKEKLAEGLGPGEVWALEGSSTGGGGGGGAPVELPPLPLFVFQFFERKHGARPLVRKACLELLLTLESVRQQNEELAERQKEQQVMHAVAKKRRRATLHSNVQSGGTAAATGTAEAPSSSSSDGDPNADDGIFTGDEKKDGSDGGSDGGSDEDDLAVDVGQGRVLEADLFAGFLRELYTDDHLSFFLHARHVTCALFGLKLSGLKTRVRSDRSAGVFAATGAPRNSGPTANAFHDPMAPPGSKTNKGKLQAVGSGGLLRNAGDVLLRPHPSTGGDGTLQPLLSRSALEQCAKALCRQGVVVAAVPNGAQQQEAPQTPSNPVIGEVGAPVAAASANSATAISASAATAPPATGIGCAAVEFDEKGSGAAAATGGGGGKTSGGGTVDNDERKARNKEAKRVGEYIVQVLLPKAGGAGSANRLLGKFVSVSVSDGVRHARGKLLDTPGSEAAFSTAVTLKAQAKLLQAVHEGLPVHNWLHLCVETLRSAPQDLVAEGKEGSGDSAMGGKMLMIEKMKETQGDDATVLKLGQDVVSAQHALLELQATLLNDQRRFDTLRQHLDRAMQGKSSARPSEVLALSEEQGQVRTRVMLNSVDQARRVKAIEELGKEKAAIEARRDFVWQSIMSSDAMTPGGSAASLKALAKRKRTRVQLQSDRLASALNPKAQTSVRCFVLWCARLMNRHEAAKASAAYFVTSWKADLHAFKSKTILRIQRAFRRRREARLAKEAALAEMESLRQAELAHDESNHKEVGALAATQAAEHERQKARARAVKQRRAEGALEAEGRAAGTRKGAADFEVERRFRRHSLRLLRHVHKCWRLEVVVARRGLGVVQARLKVVVASWRAAARRSFFERRCALHLQALYRGRVRRAEVEVFKSKLAVRDNLCDAMLQRVSLRFCGSVLRCWRLATSQALRGKQLADSILRKGIKGLFKRWHSFVALSRAERALAATTLVALVRGRAGRRAVNRLVRRHQAARRLQMWLRGVVARLQVKRMKQQLARLEGKVALMLGNSGKLYVRLCLQAWFRGTVLEKRANAMGRKLFRKVLVKVLSGWQEFVAGAKKQRAEEAFDRWEASVFIQSVWRGVLGRRKWQLERATLSAARLVQRAWRGQMGRQVLAHLRWQHRCATLVQAAYRGYYARRHLVGMRVADVLRSAEEGHYDKLLFYFDTFGPSIAAEADGDGNNCLHKASFGASRRTVKLCLHQGMDPNGYNGRGLTPLHLCLKSAKPARDEVAAYLMDHGCYIEAPDFEGNTPLLLAAKLGRGAIVGQLLDREANLLVRDHEGATVLQAATTHEQVGSVRALLDHGGVFVDEAGPEGVTPLHESVGRANKEIAVALLEAGGLPDVQDDDGFTPLMYAASSDEPAMATVLLEWGASVDCRDAEGRTALHLASEKSALAVMENLLNADADLMAADVDGDTALHVAVRACARRDEEAASSGLAASGHVASFADADWWAVEAEAVCSGLARAVVAEGDERRAKLALRSNRHARYGARTSSGDDGAGAVALSEVLTDEEVIAHALEVELRGKNDDEEKRREIEDASEEAAQLRAHAESLRVFADEATEEAEQARAMAERGVGCVEKLLASGALTHLQNEDGDQAAHLAARLGHLKSMELLIRYESPLGRRNWAELTPVGVARMHQQVHVIQYLLDTLSPEALGIYEPLDDDDDDDEGGGEAANGTTDTGDESVDDAAGSGVGGGDGGAGGQGKDRQRGGRSALVRRPPSPVAWDQPIVDQTSDWEEAWDVENQATYYFNRTTGEQTRNPPAMSAELVVKLRDFREERAFKSKVCMDSGPVQVGALEYRHYVEKEKSEAQYLRALQQSAVLVQAAWRRRQALKLVRVLRKRRNAARQIQRMVRNFLSRKREEEWRASSEAAVQIQRVWRGHSSRNFYEAFLYERLWWARHMRFFALLVQRLWSGHVFRKQVRRLKVINTLGKKLRYEQWQKLIDEAIALDRKGEGAKAPLRSFGVFDEYQLPHTTDVKFYVKRTNYGGSWDQPESWVEEDKRKREEHAEMLRLGYTVAERDAAVKFQRMWRMRVVRVNFKEVMKGQRLMRGGEEGYLQDPESTVVTANFALFKHVCSHDYDHARLLYGRCLEMMQRRGPDNAFVLFSYAIFLAVTQEADWDEIDHLCSRAHGCNFRNKTDKRATRYNLARSGFYRLMTATTSPGKKLGEAFHNYALCLQLAFKDYDGAQAAYVQGVLQAPNDAKLMDNFNYMLDTHKPELVEEGYDGFELVRLHGVQQAEQNLAAVRSRLAELETKEMHEAARRVQLHFRGAKLRAMFEGKTASVLRKLPVQELSEERTVEERYALVDLGLATWLWEQVDPWDEGEGDEGKSGESPPAKKSYWYNNETGDTTWERPVDEYELMAVDLRTFSAAVDTQSAQGNSLVDAALASAGPVASGQGAGDSATEGSGHQGAAAGKEVWGEDGMPVDIEEWEVCGDSDGRGFYYNPRTGESQWERPVSLNKHNTYGGGNDGWVLNESTGEYVHQETSTLNSAGRHQYLASSPAANSSSGGASALSASSTVWEECQDDSGRVFFYNVDTGVSSWQDPREDEEDFEPITDRGTSGEQAEFYAGVGGADESADWSGWEEEGGQKGSGQRPASMGGAWEETQDEEGYAYFYNNQTGESTYERPDGFGALVFDHSTGEERPPSPTHSVHEDDDNGGADKGGGQEEHGGAGVVEGGGWDEGEEGAWGGQGGEVIGDWEETDDEEGGTYWYNNATGDTSWERPEL